MQNHQNPGTGEPKADISVIIINWNSKEDVRRCLASFNQVDSKLNLEIIVVDNASHDGCEQMLASEFPGVRFVQSGANLGFAKGNNLGARHATGRALLFLNPDTELLEDSFSALLSRLDSLPSAGAVGCKLLNADRSLQTSCVQSFPTVLNQFLDSDLLRARFPSSVLWGTAALYSADKDPKAVEALSGACIMMKREVFDHVQGFTEAYFMYGEDLDICFKVHGVGHKVYYLAETSLVHYGGNSTQKAKSGFSYVMMRESTYRFFRLNRGLASAVCYRLAMAVTSLCRLVCIPPLMLAGNRIVRHGVGSLHKWASVLRWSIGLEAWVKS
ncbi:MAG TPA: glycosyltransferase family 2 protein [Verrucomicrobiae bacterium]|nr:glycosyltransferase family 2 protein [Verrucomicrobiae bacterium]